jgi:serine/threonine protein kinase/lipoprotein NlpI
MPLVEGTRLGAYEILAPLGMGGMGEVYRARDLKLGREVALKVLPAELSSSSERLARFEREARTVAALNHPNIVVLHSLEEEGGTRFITMELVEGQTLDRHIGSGGLPIARVIELGAALADALTAAHDQGVIHRDLKPTNVMLTRDDRVKVLDFGLAKLARKEPGLSQSRAPTVAAPISTEGDVVGTVPYMAPEQLRGETVDARSDLFALGIMLYEFTVGRRPFVGATSADISSAILRDSPEPLTRLRADVPGDLERIVNRCLEKNVRKRFQAALEVGNELRALRGSLERLEDGRRDHGAARNLASIAILPFANRSADAADEYFSDGLADELLNMLAKIRGLRVAARTSSFHFKGKHPTIGEVGSALRVDSVLEGSVRKSGNRVRISVQLVKVSDGDPLWTGTYDRTLEDIFEVQDDIAGAVVTELRKTLLGESPDADAVVDVRAEVARAAKGRGMDAEAHRLYLQARHLIDRRTREETEKGIEYLKQAIERMPAFALAWAELGLAYSRAADVGWAPVAEGYALAREAVEQALRLEPDLAEAHAQMGWIRMIHDWDWSGAEASSNRAVALAPGNSQALRGSSAIAYIRGRLPDAIALSRRALDQDPLSASSYHNLGALMHAADRFGEAEAAYRTALELAPGRIATHAALALTLLSQRRGQEALAEASREPSGEFRLWCTAIVEHALGSETNSRAALQALIDQAATAWALQIAEVHAMRGEPDAAFEWLERAYAERDGGLSEMRVSPRFRSLHRDARWAAFLRKMGLA